MKLCRQGSKMTNARSGHEVIHSCSALGLDHLGAFAARKAALHELDRSLRPTSMGAGDDDQGAAPKAADKRYDWLAERVCSFLKVKEDSWQRLLTSDAK